MNDSIKSLQKNGKSFFWAGKILPDYYLNRAADLYLFCRKLDDIADQEIKPISLKKLISIKNLITKEDYKSLNRFKIIMPTICMRLLRSMNGFIKCLSNLLVSK